VQGTQLRSCRRLGQLSRTVKRRISIFYRPLEHLLYCTQERADSRDISSYNYIGCGKSSKKVGCSIGSIWVGAEAAFNESGHGKVLESKGK